MRLSIDWSRHIETWQQSGLSQAEYCRQQGINYLFNLFNSLIDTDGELFQFVAEYPVLLRPLTSPGARKSRVKFVSPVGFTGNGNGQSGNPLDFFFLSHYFRLSDKDKIRLNLILGLRQTV